MFEKHFEQGLHYLSTVQQEDGNFLTLLSTRQANFSKSTSVHTTFITSLIFLCINNLEINPILEKIKTNCARFLLSQKSSCWSFNYWSRNSQEMRKRPYPDDLDDTFCALAGLYKYDPPLVDGNAMANIVTLLTTLEQKEGGPYTTWLVSKNAHKVWKDVDLAVNSNIAYFLFLQKIELPNLITFIESCIAKREIISLYYPSMYPIIYFISRFYRGSKKKELIKMLLSKKKNSGGWGNPLTTSLAVSSLLNFGISPEKLSESVIYLLKQQHNGTWPAYGFWIDHSKGETVYAGAPALTTVFCLEAIQKYLQTKKKIQLIKSERKKINERQRFYRQILTRVEEKFSHLDQEIKQEAHIQLRNILKKDKTRQIPLLSYYFRSSLKHHQTISNSFIEKLGTASVFGWLAYTIYDNFIDEEGDPKDLSVANIALRELTVIFREILPNQPEFQKIFHRIMDELDSANTWEAVHCRVHVDHKKIFLKNYAIPDFGTYEKIASKSFGHALGPLALLFASEQNQLSTDIESLVVFFKHYLIARQLNDDAHDWENDIKAGHISPVGAILLRKWKLLHNKKEDPPLTLLIPELQKIFWYQTINEICGIVFEHLILARKALYKIPTVNHSQIFEQLLSPVENAMNQAITESKNTHVFIQHYS